MLRVCRVWRPETTSLKRSRIVDETPSSERSTWNQHMRNQKKSTRYRSTGMCHIYHIRRTSYSVYHIIDKSGLACNCCHVSCIMHTSAPNAPQAHRYGAWSRLLNYAETSTPPSIISLVALTKSCSRHHAADLSRASKIPSGAGVSRCGPLCIL